VVISPWVAGWSVVMPGSSAAQAFFGLTLSNYYISMKTAQAYATL